MRSYLTLTLPLRKEGKAKYGLVYPHVMAEFWATIWEERVAPLRLPAHCKTHLKGKLCAGSSIQLHICRAATETKKLKQDYQDLVDKANSRQTEWQ